MMHSPCLITKLLSGGIAVLVLSLAPCAAEPTIEPVPVFFIITDGKTVLFNKVISPLQKIPDKVAGSKVVLLETGMSLPQVTAILDSLGGGYEGPRPRDPDEPYEAEVVTVIYMLNRPGLCPTRQDIFILFDKHDQLVGGTLLSSGCIDIK